MELTIVIPTTGELPEFVDMAMKMIKAQTYPQELIKEVLVVNNDGPGNTLVQNYREGYEMAQGDLVVAWEHDDYYDPFYLETMVRNWEPDLEILGVASTLYYHIGIRKWKLMEHPPRTSMFNVIMKPGLQTIPWNGDAFLDHRISAEVRAQRLKGKFINELRAVGIKHGIGSPAGSGHKEDFPYKNEDPNMSFLRTLITDPEIFEFYRRKGMEISG